MTLHEYSGGVTNRLDFSAWGETLRATGQQIPRYGWCGAHGYQDLALPARGSEANPPADSSYGLIHIGARYYAPDLGRCIMRDPIGMGGGGNVYVYCENAPPGHVDPTGYMSVNNVSATSGIQAQIQSVTAEVATGAAYRGGVKLTIRMVEQQTGRQFIRDAIIKASDQVSRHCRWKGPPPWPAPPLGL